MYKSLGVCYQVSLQVCTRLNGRLSTLARLGIAIRKQTMVIDGS